MRPFLRSENGRTNERLFHKTDIVVVVEGGKCKGEQIESQGPDLLFWQEIFQILRPDLQISIKSVGCKTNALQEAESISSGKVRQRVVALDSDYDELFGKKIVHPRILYTWGYSHENDLWHRDSLASILARCHKRQELDLEDAQAISAGVLNLTHAFRWLLRVDARLYLTTGYGLCGTKADLQKLFKCKKKCAPEFDRESFRNALKAAKKGVLKDIERLENPSLDGLRWGYGKLVARVLRDLVNSRLDRSPKNKLRDDNQLELLLAVFRRQLQGDSIIRSYYLPVLEAV